MNLYDDKDTIIHRLRTHISILEQQQNSNGYFSYDETPSLNEQYSVERSTKDNADELEKLLQKREYELAELREQFNEFQKESDEKVQRTIEQFNNLQTKYSFLESERNNLRQELQQLQDENDLIKSYMNRLPSEIEYEKLQQSYKILEDQLKQSNDTINQYRKEKNSLKKQVVSYQQITNQHEQTIQSYKISNEKDFLNAKTLTIDERKQTEEKFQEFKQIIEKLKQELNNEISNRQHQEHLHEKNTHIVQSLTNDIAKKEQMIKEFKNILRQKQQELSDLQVRLVVSEEEQIRLNERLLTNDQLSIAMRRVHSTIEKLFLVLDFSFEMINNDSTASPDVLMLQLSKHKNKSDSIENVSKIDLSHVENLESKLDEIIDRLLSIRSELIARQFENDLQTNIPCRLQ